MQAELKGGRVRLLAPPVRGRPQLTKHKLGDRERVLVIVPRDLDPHSIERVFLYISPQGGRMQTGGASVGKHYEMKRVK